MKKWTLNSWKNYPVKHIPKYEDEKELNLVLNKLEIQRLSVSGVSLDEEMTHMIQYEQAYNAAAKLVSTVDEMISSILSIV